MLPSMSSFRCVQEPAHLPKLWQEGRIQHANYFDPAHFTRRPLIKHPRRASSSTLLDTQHPTFLAHLLFKHHFLIHVLRHHEGEAYWYDFPFSAFISCSVNKRHSGDIMCHGSRREWNARRHDGTPAMARSTNTG
jgi:hypothetical protein